MTILTIIICTFNCTIACMDKNQSGATGWLVAILVLWRVWLIENTKPK